MLLGIKYDLVGRLNVRRPAPRKPNKGSDSICTVNATAGGGLDDGRLLLFDSSLIHIFLLLRI